jgi:hypothetical protein
VRSLDRDTAERLLDGQITGDDAPQGYGAVARVIAVLRAPEKTEHRRPAPVVAGTARAVHGTAAATRSRVPRQQLMAATVVLSGILTVSLAGAGALPGPVQEIGASVLDRVGMHVPVTDGDLSTGHSVTPAGARTD